MSSAMFRRLAFLLALVALALSAKFAQAQAGNVPGTGAIRLLPTVFPEQRSIQVRDPAQLPHYQLPDEPYPHTVSRAYEDLKPRYLSLDEAIRISIQNVNVVRVLAGTAATNSGRSIYDVGIANTSIDQQNARFDPTVNVNQSWNHLDTPGAIRDPLDPVNKSILFGARGQNYTLGASVTKQNIFGGTTALQVDSNTSRNFPPLALNPQARSSAALSYTQPLLQGAGIGPNLAPIVVARIDTERSYFQLKDSMQENVRGVIEAYWLLVFARTDAWARRKQVENLTEAVRRIRGRVKAEFDNAADLSQAQSALSNARATLIGSEANVIQREAALRNILGMPPEDGWQIYPVSPPTVDRFVPNWKGLCQLAEERRPDLIELKLILEADGQLLTQARNNALPRVDAVGLYRWNGLEGEMPDGSGLKSGPGQFTDWTLGVNFSVPIGLRSSRAGLRRQELLIARDRVNLEQGLHATVHSLATNVRSIDQAYEQYLAIKEARRAATINLDAQTLRYSTQQAILLNVLQAVSDWANSISAEANALTQYNTLLATLERQSGTILEAHGVVFFEERYASIGPLGRLFPDVCYPESMRPTPNDARHAVSDEPAEESFQLVPPRGYGDKPFRIPYEDLPGLGAPEPGENVIPQPLPSPIPSPLPPPAGTRGGPSSRRMPAVPVSAGGK